MSSYIIAGSAENPDTAYCQEVANKIKAKYSNIDFRIIIKHPTEWDSHIQEVCRIYGFPRRQNPIIYTFDGKMIGDKHAFLTTCRNYFGITQKEMGIGIVSTDVNMKLAELELNKKLKMLRGQKTMAEIIDQKLQERLNNKVFVYKLPDYKKKIEKGLVFYIREVEGMVDSIKFEVEKISSIKNEETTEEEIDLAAIAQSDQIPAVEEHRSGNHSEKEKDPFLTHQDEDKRSRTNGSQRLHESVHSRSHISHEGGGLKRSSVVKDRSNSIKPQAIQPQKPEFDLVSVENYVVSDLENDFYLVFDSKPIVLGGLKVVKSAPTDNGLFQMNYEKYPRKVVGHLYNKGPKIVIDSEYMQKHVDALSEHQQDAKDRELPEPEEKVEKQQIKAEHKSNNLKVQELQIRQIESQNVSSVQPSEMKNSDVNIEGDLTKQLNEKAVDNQHKEDVLPEVQSKQGNDDAHEQNKTNLDNSQFEFKNKKLRTQVDVKQFEEKKQKATKSIIEPRDKYLTGNILDKLEHSQADFAEPVAQQIDPKALNFLEPWTLEEIQKTYQVVSSAGGVAVLQFKPENPNPVINVYLRKHLNSATINSPKEIILPVEEVIMSSFDQQELTPIQPASPIGFMQKLMFSHLIARVNSADLIPDLCHQMLAFLVRLEEKYKRFIGYNIVLSKEYLMIAPLIDHYEIYNEEKLYLDGLALIGVVHIPKLNSPFMIQKRELKSPYEYIRASFGDLQDIEELIKN